MQIRLQLESVYGPKKELYGRKGNELIAPLDLLVDNAGNLPDIPGTFVGEKIVTPGGGLVGTILSYDWPPSNPFEVRPVVTIQPDSNLSLRGIPDIAVTSAPMVALKDAVTLDIGTGINGSIVVADEPVIRAYSNFSTEVQTYRVDFNQQLLSDTHGGRVTIDATNQLLGMLIATQNRADGSCQALVFPADRI